MSDPPCVCEPSFRLGDRGDGELNGLCAKCCGCCQCSLPVFVLVNGQCMPFRDPVPPPGHTRRRVCRA